MMRLRISCAGHQLAELNEDGGLVFVWWSNQDHDPDLSRLIDEAQLYAPMVGVSVGEVIEWHARRRPHWRVERVPESAATVRARLGFSPSSDGDANLEHNLESLGVV